jgi:hypothetical protein
VLPCRFDFPSKLNILHTNKIEIVNTSAKPLWFTTTTHNFITIMSNTRNPMDCTQVTAECPVEGSIYG